MDDAARDLSFFGSTHAAQDGIMREEVDCNTYRLEITNEGHTCDGCRLDAHNFPLARCMVGEGKENEKISPKNLF